MSEQNGAPPVPGDFFAADEAKAVRLVKDLERMESLIPKILQLKGRHRATLPQGVWQLSRMLTSERGELSVGYLQNPANLAAYMAYFLPWNVRRLTRLLPGLGIALPDKARILDLGSGPLTLPLALWAACPELRTRRLTFVCSDRSKKVMSLGAQLLRELLRTGPGGENWRIELLHAPLEKALEQQRGKVALLTLCNVLNETGGRRGREGLPRLQGLVRQAAGKLADQGRMLAVEPGTRVGGGLIATLRDAALHAGFSALGPCTHQHPCPLRDRRQGMWCHFGFSAGHVPAGLQRLSKQAGLEKETLSLSFAWLGFRAPEQGNAARIISHPFTRPGKPPAAYGCGPDGLLLVEAKNTELLWPGRGLTYTSGKERDGKSGALVVWEKL